jgi:hypothetical protein
MTIVNDATSCSVTLELSIVILESSITLLESSFTLLESSITLPENFYSTGFTYNHY